MSDTAFLIQTSPGAVEWRPVNDTRIRWGLVSSRTDAAAGIETLTPTVSLSVARSDTADLENCSTILVNGLSYQVERQDRLYDGDVVRLALSGPPWHPGEDDGEQALVRQLLETSPGAVTWSIEVAIASVDEVPNWDAVPNVDLIGTGGGGGDGTQYPGLVNQRTAYEADSDMAYSVTMLEACARDLLPVSNCTRLVIDGRVWTVERRIQQGDGQLMGAILGRQVD